MEIILDMGNVLLEWNKDKILKAVAKTQKDYLILDKAIFSVGTMGKVGPGDLDSRRIG